MASTALLELRLKPDSLAEALPIIHRILDETRAFDGCLGVTVVRDKDDPAHVVAIEEWESLEKDAAYRAWRAGDGAATDLPALLDGAPNLIIAEVRSDL